MGHGLQASRRKDRDKYGPLRRTSGAPMAFVSQLKIGQEPRPADLQEEIAP
ncbi:hypothetical protein K1T71_007329 [Dendrolimus kikuchii]|uniref:Uncharacterized protein n=1 Tax=Dendrolimus kikuchii TaxID=765133 RepID=A0ACC1D0P8_9NEOP|nr:hypothetical protein K1T71_007329 [Dendrolimus kikuchii]